MCVYIATVAKQTMVVVPKNTYQLCVTHEHERAQGYPGPCRVDKKAEAYPLIRHSQGMNSVFGDIQIVKAKRLW